MKSSPMAKGENSGEGERSSDSIFSGMRGLLRIRIMLLCVKSSLGSTRKQLEVIRRGKVS